MNFSTLPNLIALAILVVVFWAISRKAIGEQVHLWLIGWVLVLVHFAAQFAATASGVWGVVATSVSLDSLILAGVAFLISVSAIVSNRRSKVFLALAIAVPALLTAMEQSGASATKAFITACAGWNVWLPWWCYGATGSGAVFMRLVSSWQPWRPE
jgi:hypothetical protein